MHHKYIHFLFLISLLGFDSACKKSDVDTIKYSPSSPIMFYRLGQGTTLTSMQQTADGGIIFCGYEFSGSSSNIDGFLMKTDARGIMQWKQTYGGSESDQFNMVRQTTDGGFVMVGYTNSYGNGAIRGDFYTDAWIVKTDSLGNLIWQKTLGDIYSDNLTDVQEMADHSLVMAGYGVFPNIFFGNAYCTQAYVVKMDHSGNVILSGVLSQFRKYYRSSASAVAITPGGFAIIGRVVKSNYVVDQGTFYPFTASIGGANGNTVLWSRVDSAIGTTTINPRILNSGNGLVAAIQSNDYGGNIRVYKTDFSGNLLWNKLCKTDGGDILNCFQNNTDGNLLLGGNTNDNPAAGNLPFLLTLNSSGLVTDETDFPVKNINLNVVNIIPGSNGFRLGLAITSEVVNDGNNFGLMNIDKNGKLVDDGNK